jgi:hypothetical protein
MKNPKLEELKKDIENGLESYKRGEISYPEFKETVNNLANFLETKEQKKNEK